MMSRMKFFTSLRQHFALKLSLPPRVYTRSLTFKQLMSHAARIPQPNCTCWVHTHESTFF